MENQMSFILWPVDSTLNNAKDQYVQDNVVTVRNTANKEIRSPLSGKYTIDPFNDGDEIVKIEGKVKGNDVSVIFMDGIDIAPGQPKTGEIKQGDLLSLGEPGAYLRFQFYLNGQRVDHGVLGSTVAPIYLPDQIAQWKATGKPIDNVATPQNEAAGEKGASAKSGGIATIAIVGVVLWALKKAIG